ncbi:MAG TPA: ABC transporter substrate-binding protein, partial [Acidimicrobiales bacterium]|nr:ABC transporter substrate-binding protein [Acidimicrobiales bacterium]
MAGTDRYDRRTFLGRGATGAAALAFVGIGGPTLLSACSSSSSSVAAPRVSTPGIGVGPPRQGGSITVGVNSEIDGFLPADNHFDNSGTIYANSVYDTLTAIAADGSAQPSLAQSVTPNADLTAWTVGLRPGISFHDGSPLTSDVVVTNFQALRQSPLTGPAVQIVSAVTATDPLTVVFHFTEPIVAFPYYMATQVGYVVALAQLNSQNGSAHPIGTGPFIYESWVPNDHFTVRRNPHYWRSGLPYLDSITYKPIVEDQSRQSSLQSGTIDLMVSRNPHAAVELRDDPSVQLVTDADRTHGQNDVAFIYLNCQAEPLSDLTVRQALAYATDTHEIATLFGAGILEPISSPFPVGSPYRAPDNGYPAFDLDMAKSLVAQAAPRHGGRIRFDLSTIPDPLDSEVIQALQAMWAEAGVQASVSQIEEVTYIDNLALGTFQACTGDQFDADDPDENYIWW